MLLLGILCLLAGLRTNEGRQDLFTLQNDFVKVEISQAEAAIVALYGDFQGKGNFKKNVLSRPFQLESVDTSGNFFPVDSEAKRVKVKCWEDPATKEQFLRLEAAGVYQQATIKEEWVLSLVTARGGRSAVLLSSAALPTFRSALQEVVWGSYESSSREIDSAWSAQCWQRVAAGESSSSKAGASWQLALSLLPNDFNFPAHAFAKAASAVSSREVPSLRDIEAYNLAVYGSVVGCLQSYYKGQKGIIAPTISSPDVGYSPDTNFFDPDNFLSLSALLYSDDSYLLDQVQEVLWRTAQTMCGLGSEANTTYCNEPRTRLRSLVGTRPLPEERRAMALNALLDPLGDSKEEKLADSGNLSRWGQIMHHFIALQPTYSSIAGSEQLGPNIFWSLTVLRYLQHPLVSRQGQGEESFLRRILPYLNLSLQYVLSFLHVIPHTSVERMGVPKAMYQQDLTVALAPGPLWIDVLVREFVASDSQAMVIYYLDTLASFYRSLDGQRYGSSCQELENLAADLRHSMNALLWREDHYVTQYNPSDGSVRDFVDYDSNLIAITAGVPQTSAQAESILERIDRNSKAHVRATWCSELPYSGDACDCYIVGGSVCGDSVVTLARIGYMDALARKKLGGYDSFIQDTLLQPLQDDLLQYVWLYERYNETGQQVRTPFYFEYPSLVVMLLREVVYGIHVNWTDFSIDPLLAHYHLRTSGMEVVYGVEEVSVSLFSPHGYDPVKEELMSRNCLIHSLLPQLPYDVTNGEHKLVVATDERGTLAFPCFLSSSILAKLHKE
eukprot:scaffold2822_cov192-Ochromonas_danica.AAC.2